jgi:hypothetical protein
VDIGIQRFMSLWSIAKVAKEGRQMDEVMKPIVCILANFIINVLLKKKPKKN